MHSLRSREQPASCFYGGDRPLRAADMTDPYRRGMFVIARATSRAERAWLLEVLGDGVDTPHQP